MVDIGEVVPFYTSENVFHARSIPWKCGFAKAISGSRLTIKYTIGDSILRRLLKETKSK